MAALCGSGWRCLRGCRGCLCYAEAAPFTREEELAYVLEVDFTPGSRCVPRLHQGLPVYRELDDLT